MFFFSVLVPSTVDFIPSPAAFIKHSTSLITATIEALNLEFTTGKIHIYLYYLKWNDFAFVHLFDVV